MRCCLLLWEHEVVSLFAFQDDGGRDAALARFHFGHGSGELYPHLLVVGGMRQLRSGPEVPPSSFHFRHDEVDIRRGVVLGGRCPSRDYLPYAHQVVAFVVFLQQIERGSESVFHVADGLEKSIPANKISPV